MTRDEHRAKCIEAQALAYVKRWQDGASRADSFAAAFDALHGLARVTPLEATDEMIDAAKPICPDIGTYKAMAAAGDLTNPPKP